MRIRVSAPVRAGIAFATSALFAAASAAAEEAPRLEYAVGDGTPGCPSETEFRDAVAARLGRDAFAAESRRRLVVDVRLEGGELRATGALVEADGSSAGIRRMTGGDCREVVEGMALAVSLAISGEFAIGAEPENAPPPVAPNSPEPKAAAKTSAQPPAPPPATPATRRVDRGVAAQEATDQRPDPLDRAIAREGLRIARAALEALELGRRAVFILHDLDEVSMPEVARELGIPLNTAYSRLRLARSELARTVERFRNGALP